MLLCLTSEPLSTSPAKTTCNEPDAKTKRKRKAYQADNEKDIMWKPSCNKLDGQPIKKTDSMVADWDVSLVVSQNM